MKRIAIFLSLMLATLGVTGPAFAEESAAVSNYKKAVERELSSWAANYKAGNDEMTRAAAERAALMKQDPKPADYAKRLEAIETRMKNAQAQIDYATNSAVVAIGLLEVPFSKKDDPKPLVAFVQTVIKEKGVPLSKNFIITPTASWNWKNNTLGSIGVKIRFQSKWF